MKAASEACDSPRRSCYVLRSENAPFYCIRHNEGEKKLCAGFVPQSGGRPNFGCFNLLPYEAALELIRTGRANV